MAPMVLPCNSPQFAEIFGYSIIVYFKTCIDKSAKPAGAQLCQLQIKAGLYFG